MLGHLIRWRRLWIPILGLTVILALVWVFQDALVSASADFLIDPDKPEKADLIYILGGNYEVRAPLAAHLFREGWAPKILLAREPSSRQFLMGEGENFTDRTIQILQSEGVPKDRIIDFEPRGGVTSTADEAHVLKLYVRSYPVHKILVVTSSFHSRRARMAMERALIGTGIQVRLIVAENQDYTRANWRQTEYGRSQVKLEWIKTIYYFLTFWG